MTSSSHCCCSRGPVTDCAIVLRVACWGRIRIYAFATGECVEFWYGHCISATGGICRPAKLSGRDDRLPNCPAASAACRFCVTRALVSRIRVRCSCGASRRLYVRCVRSLRCELFGTVAASEVLLRRERIDRRLLRADSSSVEPMCWSETDSRSDTSVSMESRFESCRLLLVCIDLCFSRFPRADSVPEWDFDAVSLSPVWFLCEFSHVIFALQPPFTHLLPLYTVHYAKDFYKKALKLRSAHHLRV